MFPQYSKVAINKHAKKPLNGEPVFDKRKTNKGRPKKLTVRDERSILRTRKYMHAETLALLTKPLYIPNMKYLKLLSW